MNTTLFREYMIRVVTNIPCKWDADGTPTQWILDESDATVIVDNLIDAFVVALTGAGLPDPPSLCRDPERHPSGRCDGSCYTLHPVDD